MREEDEVDDELPFDEDEEEEDEEDMEVRDVREVKRGRRRNSNILHQLPSPHH